MADIGAADEPRVRAFRMFLALDVRAKLHWDARTTLIVLADAVVPFGGFLVARRSDVR